MAQLTDRLIVALARVCGWAVLLIPVALILGLAARSVVALFGAVPPLQSNVVGPALATLSTALAAAVIGGLLGVTAAVLAQELAFEPVRQVIRTVVGFFAATPAVIVGWFGAVAITPVTTMFGAAGAAAAAVIVLSIMIIPTASVLSIRTLRRLPTSVREAAVAAGANRVQTILRIVLVSARRGIAGAFVIAFARAAGEATAVQIVLRAVAAQSHSTFATLASALLTFGSSDVTGKQGIVALEALVLSAIVIAAGWYGRRLVGELRWA